MPPEDQLPLSDLSPAEVKAFRKAVGLSQAGLASKVGVSPQGVERWEKQGAPGYWRFVFAALAAGLKPWSVE